MRMKTKSAALLVLLCACWHTQAQDSSNWNYDLPETGILPSYTHVALTSSMHERHHGASRLGWQRYALTIPFSDPYSSHFGEWRFNAQLDVKLTLLDTSGTMNLAHENLSTWTLPFILVHPDKNGNRLSLAVAPELSSDFHAVSHGWDIAAFAEYRIQHSETLEYGVGVWLSPRFASRFVVPLCSLEWNPSSSWSILMRGYRLSALYKISPSLEIGPFVEGIGGIWSVETDRGARVFRVASLVAGLTCEYDFSSRSQRKRVVTAAIGSTLTTTAQFCERNGGKDVYEAHHYHPGVYASIGVDFRF